MASDRNVGKDEDGYESQFRGPTAKLVLLFRHPSSGGHLQTEPILGVCPTFTHPFLKFQSLPVITTLAAGLPFSGVRYWKFLALPSLIAALLSIPSSAPAQVSMTAVSRQNIVHQQNE